jgi:hypothetical protein
MSLLRLDLRLDRHTLSRSFSIKQSRLYRLMIRSWMAVRCRMSLSDTTGLIAMIIARNEADSTTLRDCVDRENMHTDKQHTYLVITYNPGNYFLQRVL